MQQLGLCYVSGLKCQGQIIYIHWTQRSTPTHLSFQVVFHKMSPNETLFLESTNKIYKDDISSSSFVNFQIWDFPGQVDFFDPTFDYEMIFRGTGALIFVIDAQVKNRAKININTISCYGKVSGNKTN